MSSKATLRLYRQRLHMSTTELGNHLDVSDKTVRNWEMGNVALPEKVLTDTQTLLDQFEESWDVLANLAEKSPYGISVGIYRGYVKSNTEQCPPNTWMAIVAEAMNASGGRITPLFPEDGDPDLRVMPTPLADLPCTIEKYTT